MNFKLTGSSPIWGSLNTSYRNLFQQAYKLFKKKIPHLTGIVNVEATLRYNIFCSIYIREEKRDSVPSTETYYYYYLVCEAIGTAGTPGLLCQPRVIVKMIAEKQMECRLEGETEVLGENLPQRHFCPSQNPTSPDPGLNPGRRGGKPATI
jgi:hypothetical protein